MRVLHIINSLEIGGAEKLVAETLPRFAAKNISVELLLLNGRKTPLYEELEQKGIKIHGLGQGSLYHPKYIFKLIPFFKNYNIFHIHLFPAQYFAGIAKILSKSKVKLIFTEHSTSNRRIEGKFYKFPEKLIYAQYSKIICITNGVKTALQKHISLDEKKLAVIENGIDLEKISLAEPLRRSEISDKIKDGDFLVLQVSGFRVGKDQATLIKSLKFLPENVKIIFAGDGVTKSEHERLAEELSVKERIIFLGVRNDVLRLLKSVDASVLSSNYEGLSLASLESMASGKPFIASDVSGLREIVSGAGILFPNGDAQKFAEEIIKLMKNQTHYEEVSRRCIARAAEFDISKMVEKTVELYREIL